MKVIRKTLKTLAVMIVLVAIWPSWQRLCLRTSSLGHPAMR